MAAPFFKNDGLLERAYKFFPLLPPRVGDALFESYISQSVGLIEASSMGMSIFEYSPKSKSAQCYKEVAEELLKRLEGKASSIEIPKRKPPVKKSAFGALAEYANPALIPFESCAWERAAVERYAKSFG